MLATDLIPGAPASWYLFCSEREVRRRPVSRDLFGRRLVAYQSASGKLCLLDGRCAHLGADLGEGCVVGEELQCAFHNWRYDSAGRCSLVPYAASPPRFQLRTYPVVARHGFLFFFNGAEPLFPLPFFAGADPADYVAAAPLRYEADCPWYLVNGNSFDVQHFRTVHGRRLIGEPVIDVPSPFARRIRLTFEVVGNSVFDRLLRRFVGDRVQVSMTNWGGTVIEVIGEFRNARSSLLSFIDPLDQQQSRQNVLAFVQRGRLGPAADLCRVWLRRLFTHGYMAEEFTTLAGIRFNPKGTVPSDQPLIDFLHWLTELPQQGPEWLEQDHSETESKTASLFTESRA